MNVYLWAFLFVILIPFAEGVLIALLLREVNARNPLPLVEPGYIPSWDYSQYQEKESDFVEEQETADESAIDDAAIDDAAAENEEVSEGLEDQSSESMLGNSVFDGAVNVPQDLLVGETLDSMTAGGSEAMSGGLEDMIEESAIIKGGPEVGVQGFRNDLDEDDLEDLAAALPTANIDFSEELDITPDESEPTEPIAPMVKELLGEDFDFEGLEKQAKESFKFLAPAPERSTEDLSAVALDIQESEPGTIQVASPFLYADSPQLADFAVPETILPTFSHDWIQETSNTVEAIEGDTSNFCFTEEMQPMLVRKKPAKTASS